VAHYAAPFALEAEQHPDDAYGSLDDPARGRDLAPAIGRPRRAVRYQREQRLLVLRPERGDKALQHPLLGFGWYREPRPGAPDALPRAVDQLPAGRLTLLEHARDLGVVGVEDVAEQERGSLLQPQPLQQDEERHREIRGHLRAPVRVEVGRRGDGLWQPGADVMLTLARRPPQPVDPEPGGHGHEPRLRRPHLRGVGAMPPEVGLLHHVFRVLDGAEHSIRDAEQARPVLLEHPDVRELGLRRHAFRASKADVPGT